MIIYFDDVVIRQIGDRRSITFTWPRSGETFTYEISLNGGDTFAAGLADITELSPDGDVAEYEIAYADTDRNPDPGLVVYKVTDGKDEAKIYVNVLSGKLQITTSGNYFTSLEEIQRMFSIEGVNNHLEDYAEDPDLQDVIDEIIIRATETVLQYLRGRYVVSDMETSYWVRMKATFIACYYLSLRQGNPSLYQDQYQESLLDLAMARDGVINPGLNTPMRVITQTPMMDSRFFHNSRVDPARSNKIYSGQRMPYRISGSPYE